MAAAPTTNLQIVRVQDDHTSTKIPTINTGMVDLDTAIAGFITVDIPGTGDVSIGVFGRSQSLNPVLKFTGTLTGNRTVYMTVALGSARRFTAWNATSGAFTLTIKTTAGGSTGKTITQGKCRDLFHDNTNVYASGPEETP